MVQKRPRDKGKNLLLIAEKKRGGGGWQWRHSKEGIYYSWGTKLGSVTRHSMHFSNNWS